MNEGRQLPGGRPAGAPRPLRPLLVWPARLLIFAVALLISFGVLIPTLGGLLGMIAAALVAALALAGEIALSSKINGESLERTAARRVVLVDKALAPRDTEPLQGPEHRHLAEAEEVEAEVLEEPEERPRLES